ncbi:hypothetical protein GBF38_016886, partial [Nibea albiflora]
FSSSAADADMEIFAPVEFDSEDSANSAPEGAESPSLLPPVSNSTEPLRPSYTQTAQAEMTVMKGKTPTVPQQTSANPPLSPDRSSAAPPETVCASPHPSHPKPINSTRFWKDCNVAGCTQAVFAEFIREMEEISSRIQSDAASQDDYDCALRVMEASGKLAELVIRQQEELIRKHTELKKAAAAMMEVLSALKR